MFLPVLASTLPTIGGMAPLLFETGLLLFLLPAMIGIADDIGRILRRSGRLFGIYQTAKS